MTKRRENLQRRPRPLLVESTLSPKFEGLPLDGEPRCFADQRVRRIKMRPRQIKGRRILPIVERCKRTPNRAGVRTFRQKAREREKPQDENSHRFHDAKRL